jgi:hypothetical protein
MKALQINSERELTSSDKLVNVVREKHYIERNVERIRCEDAQQGRRLEKQRNSYQPWAGTCQSPARGLQEGQDGVQQQEHQQRMA